MRFLEPVINFLREVFLPDYKPKQQSFSQLPSKLQGKIFKLLALIIGLLIVALAMSMASNWYFMLSGGLLCSGVGVYILITLYTYTRHNYAVILCTVVHRHIKSSAVSLFSREKKAHELVTVGLDDGTQRDITTYNETLNVGCRYVVYTKLSNDGSPNFREIIAIDTLEATLADIESNNLDVLKSDLFIGGEGLPDDMEEYNDEDDYGDYRSESEEIQRGRNSEGPKVLSINDFRKNE